MNIRQLLPTHIRYLLKVYLTGIAFFTVFRIILFLTNLQKLHALPADERFSLISRAFLMGLRFDTVILGYILCIPLFVLSFTAPLKGTSKHLLVYKIVFIYIGLIFTASLFICAADIQYFNYYNSRVTAIIFNWFDSPGFLAKLVFQEIGNYFYLLAFALCCAFFWFLLNGYRKKAAAALSEEATNQPRPVLKIAVISTIAILLLFVGMRGRVAQKSPIRVGTAYFSNYSFPNQLGLNSVFTFSRSVMDRVEEQGKELNFMPDDKAIDLVRAYLGLEKSENHKINIETGGKNGGTGENENKTFHSESFPSPIARRIEPTGPALHANVVVVIMESMAAAKMRRYGNPDNLTPYLDSLAEQAITFDNIYTSGTHTSNGIYSTLFGYTALIKQHPLKPTPMLSYAGIANILQSKGYRTVYFTTHDQEFDNVGGFLHANGFEKIISEKDYPAEKVLSTLGVPDDYLFEFSIPVLNELHASNHPFLSVIMTCSDHPPYILPDHIPFTPHSNNKYKDIVEYADWSLSKFMNLASQQPWFDNTLFVFIADHGANINSIYDMPLSYHHTPLIFYSPTLIKEPQSFSKVGGQIDVFPTIMGILNMPYVNNTLGIDLLKETRPYIYFSADDKTGCLNDDYFLVMRDNGIESLYAYKKRDLRDYISSKSDVAAAMKKYFFAMMQTTQWLIKNDKVGMQAH